MKTRNVVVVSLVASLFGSLAAQARLTPKQLSGPIDEVRTGVMAEVDPVVAGIRSKSAMIPVDLTPTKAGDWRWQGELAVDGSHFKMVLFAGQESWNIRLGNHAKSMDFAHKLASGLERTSLDMGNNSFEGDYYQFTEATPGNWAVEVTADAPAGTQGYLLYSADSPYRLLSYQAHNRQWVGQELSFVGYGFEKVGDVPGLEANAGLVTEASLRITGPDGAQFVAALFDDGLHGDEAAGDGIFGGGFVPQQAGNYTVQMIARGTTPEGLPFVRTAEHLVPVVEPHLELTRDFADARLADDRRLEVSLPVANGPDAPDHYRVFAEVWGADAAGDMKPVSWIGGMSYVEDGELTLGLDLRWIGRSEALSHFELRNVRIEDPDHFVSVMRLAHLPLLTPTLPDVAHLPTKAIDEEMLMGPRPARTGGAKAGRLLLVHGYCSGDAWGPVSGQFSSASVFQDFNKNRSHDYFAQLIGNFGSSWSSFGVVAHSQGGAATLHLYTYYWSGLDYASGSRLIQSVGTPYQGTALAGNAAVLGQIFGVGCGTNTDLTYSGAASWLSGVPSWARSKVNYYTTSFNDRWWAYDYCHLVTDVLLGDPDDGTTEKAYGQLSGASNRGHKTGWCHTTGMRDPAQVKDSSRNSTMNSYAAR